MSLRDVLKLDRKLVILDTETTSLDTNEARIVEIGLQILRPNEPDIEWRTLVNPLVIIEPEVTAIHGITNEQVTGCQECGRSKAEHEALDAGPQPESLFTVNDEPPIEVHGLAIDHSFKPWPTFRQLALRMAANGLSACDYAGKNVRFDLKVMAAEMARAGVAWSYADAYVIDADRIEAMIEPRDLKTLYKRRTGKDLPDAHQALVDVRATVELIAAQLATADWLPRTAKELHDLSWPNWIDCEGKFRFLNGVAIVNFGKHKYKPMSKVPPDYWNFILSPREKFSQEVKNLAAKAKLGEYPIAGDRAPAVVSLPSDVKELADEGHDQEAGA